MHSAQRDKTISCCGGLCANLLVWGLRNAWAVVLSSVGISERSQGLFALAAALRANILPLALLRHMLRMGGSVGGEEGLGRLPAFIPSHLSLRADSSLL